MIGKVRVRDDNANEIAEIEFCQGEYGAYSHIASKNVKKWFIENEQTNEQGFIDVLDIDIDISVNQQVLESIMLVSRQIGAMDEAYRDEYGRELGIGDAIHSILKEIDKYDGFQATYNEKEWDKKDNTCDGTSLSEDDFYNANITESNYHKANVVICDIADDFLIFLKEQLI